MLVGSMDIYTRRRLRLRQLISERFPEHGGKARLAALLERQAGYLSRCLNGQKQIGEIFARHIEKQLQLPPFWLDASLADRGGLSSQQVALLQAFEKLLPEQKSELLSGASETARRNLAAYEYLKALLPENTTRND
jgi:hypothetical protein